MATPDYDSVTNLLDLWRETNAVTDFLFSYLFLLSVFIIVMVIMQMFDRRHVFVSSSLITTILALFLFLADLVPFGAFIVSLVLFSASIVWLLFGSNEY